MKNKKALFLICISLSLTSCGLVSVSSSEKTSSSVEQTSEQDVSSSKENTSSNNASSSTNEISSSDFSSSSKATSSSKSSGGSSSSSSSSSFVYNNPDYEEFFDPSSQIDIVMDFTKTALVNLSAMGGTTDTTYHDVYHPCLLTITVNGESTLYGAAGVRMKGGDYSRNPITTGSEAMRLPGTFSHFKVNVTAMYDDPIYEGIYSALTDETIKERRIYGDGKKIDLKWNRNYDQTYTKENYANYMLNEEGILAQRVNNCKLTIKMNGEALSGYENIPYHVYESVDKQFLQRRMSKKEAGGNLYKGGYSSMGAPDLNDASNAQFGVEDNFYNYHFTYSLKTNESTADHTLIKDCINTISKDDTELTNVKSSVSAVVDMDYLIKYCALMWVIGNPDDFRYNSNNSYFYFNGKTGKMYIIPYDNDRCFGINIHGAMNTSLSDPEDLSAGYNGSGTIGPRILKRVIATDDANLRLVNEWHTIYLEYCELYATKYLSASKFNNYTNSFAYKDNTSSYENISFSEYASNKLGTLN